MFEVVLNKNNCFQLQYVRKDSCSHLNWTETMFCINTLNAICFFPIYEMKTVLDTWFC